MGAIQVELGLQVQKSTSSKISGPPGSVVTQGLSIKKSLGYLTQALQTRLQNVSDIKVRFS